MSQLFQVGVEIIPTFQFWQYIMAVAVMGGIITLSLNLSVI